MTLESLLKLMKASGKKLSFKKTYLDVANFLKLDCSLLKEAFGWQPRWHIEEAIQKTCEFSKVWLRGGDIPAEMDREIQEFMES